MLKIHSNAFIHLLQNEKVIRGGKETDDIRKYLTQLNNELAFGRLNVNRKSLIGILQIKFPLSSTAVHCLEWIIEEES